jgi:hypothetical protein
VEQRATKHILSKPLKSNQALVWFSVAGKGGEPAPTAGACFIRLSRVSAKSGTDIVSAGAIYEQTIGSHSDARRRTEVSLHRTVSTNGPVTSSVAVKDDGALAILGDVVFHLHGCASLLKSVLLGSPRMSLAVSCGAHLLGKATRKRRKRTVSGGGRNETNL